MSKEEKAKEYAEDINLGLTGFKKDIAVTKSVQDYLVGYTTAEQDLSTQLTAYKEALKHLVNLCDTSSAEEVVFYEMEHNIDLDTVLTKAKTLIEDQQN